jgi:hypothetical protein
MFLELLTAVKLLFQIVSAVVKTVRMFSPTIQPRGSEMKNRKKNGRARSCRARRAKPRLNPKIFIRLERESRTPYFERGSIFVAAHLRNKKGYVYLCWREGTRVRNLYLGKAPRKSPTPAAPIEAAGPAPATSPGRARGSRL